MASSDMSGKVQTVLDPVQPLDLGITLSGESKLLLYGSDGSLLGYSRLDIRSSGTNQPCW